MSAEAHSTIAGRELLGIIQELEAEEQAIRDHNKVKSDIIKEAGNKGWDKKTVRKVMAARRLDPEVRNEQDDLFDLYMQAVETAEKTLVHARVENAGKFGAAKGVGAGSTPPREATQEQPVTASQSGHANEVRTDALRSSDVGKLSHDASAPAESASDDISAPIQEQPVETANQSSGKVSVSVDPSIDRVSPTGSHPQNGGDDANTGGKHENPVNHESLETSVNTSLAAREGEEAAAPIPHSPAVLPGKADKTSEAALSSTASLAPPIGTKHTDTNFGSDPLNDAPNAEADQAGADATPMVPDAPAAPSAMSARTKGDVIRLMRPFCAHADDLGKCGGQGTKHCNDCEQIKRAAQVLA